MGGRTQFMMGSPMHVVTIVARNYLPFARVLVDSLHRELPDAAPWVLLVDDGHPTGNEVPGARILTVHDIPLGRDDFDRMKMIYDVTELSTALKPFALQAVLDAGAPAATYLDPDIRVFSDISDLAALAESEGILLTPHTTEPLPRDGLLPQESDLLVAGAYNLGFVTVPDSGRSMLAWWGEHLRRDAISDPERGLFTDQRWMDLVPGMFRHHLVTDPGYNVAYWNLGPRRLEQTAAGSVTVNDRPLRFFHFSGFQPHRPWALSKYTEARPRALLSEDPVLARLCADYAGALKDAGWNPDDIPAYGFARLPEGLPVTRRMRRAYRDALIDHEERAGDAPPAVDQSGTVSHWFREPLVPGHPVTRVAYDTWTRRKDLQAVFPDPWSAHASSLAEWAGQQAWADGEFPSELARPASPGRMEGEVSGARLTRGVNLIGYLRAELGLGTLARSLLDSLQAAEIPTVAVPWSRTQSRQEARFEATQEAPSHCVDIVVVNADQLPTWVRESGRRRRPDRWTVGVWAWELPDFPQHLLPSLDLVDEVWAISTFVRDAIARHTDKPVRVVPLHVEVDATDAPAHSAAGARGRALLGLPDDRPYFLFSFDYLSEVRRKNPDGLVEAFCRAFPEVDSGPTLVIKSINGHLRRGARERLRYLARRRRDIVLVEDYLSEGDLKDLTRGALAYVSLHRSEGFGLTMAEAMALGTPVIATGWSGNRDFMTTESAALVPYRLVPVGSEAGPYAATALWAEPDLTAAAELMRLISNDENLRHHLAVSGRAAVEETLSLDRAERWVGDHVRMAWDEVQVRTGPQVRDRGGPDMAVTEEPATDSGSTEAVDPLVRQARALSTARMDTDAESRSALSPVVRRAISRLLATHDLHTEHQLQAVVDVSEALRQALIASEGRTQARYEALAREVAELRDHRVAATEERVRELERLTRELLDSALSYQQYLERHPRG